MRFIKFSAVAALVFFIVYFSWQEFSVGKESSVGTGLTSNNINSKEKSSHADVEIVSLSEGGGIPVKENNEGIEWYDNEFAKIQMKEQCKALDGYDSVAEFISNIQGDLDRKDIEYFEALFEKCQNSEVVSWGDLNGIYREEVRRGNKYAELLLFRLYPLGMKESVFWLMQSSTWSKNSEEFIKLNFNDVAFTNGQRVFYYYILKPDVYDFVVDDLVDYDDLQEIKNLASLWLVASESARREILDSKLLNN